MIEPIKRFRIGKSLLLSISQLQMQFGISPPETHKPRLKMSSSRSREDIRRRVRTHDPLLLLSTSPAANGSSSLWMYPAPQVFRYTGKQTFGEVYTLCFKGGRQMAVSRCGGAPTRWQPDDARCRTAVPRKVTMDTMLVSNRDPISQAGCCGFDPAL